MNPFIAYYLIRDAMLQRFFVAMAYESWRDAVASYAPKAVILQFPPRKNGVRNVA